MSPGARILLAASAAATIGLFYLFVSFALLVLAAWIGLLLIVMLLAARFGIAGLVYRAVEPEIQTLSLVSRSLWLSKGAEYRLKLQPADAPRLFELVARLAARLSIPPPDELCLEMTAGAWVELRGLKTGLGRTRVGVGYDLLAALSEREVEAVMAHELAHAQLIGRFFSNRLNRGLGRAATVSNGLSAMADGHRRNGSYFGMGAGILVLADALTRLCARQMAAYSRQGEFDADRGAAALCGTAAIRSSLERLEACAPVLNRLPWNERIARIESPDGLAGWLMRQLAPDALPPREAEDETLDRYSTHPPLRDRLAALPDDGSVLVPSPGALGLLAAPDVVALQLVAVIERTALAEEKADLRHLRKWLRSVRRHRQINLSQGVGLIVLLGGLFGSVFMFADRLFAIGLATVVGAIVFGAGLFWLGRHRDRRALAVPDFATFMQARKDFPLPDLDARQKVLEEELRAAISSETRRKAKGKRLVDEAFASLARGDYLRAHVAARMAEEFDRNGIERAMAMMIAGAAFDQTDMMGELFTFLIHKTGLRTPGTTWAAAWAFSLVGDWMPAEAFLHETLKSRPDDLHLTAVLAFVQSRRGKLQSAIAAIRRTCEPQPPTSEHRRLLVHLLLDRGSLREAGARLDEFESADASDPDLPFLRIRLHLQRHEFESAELLLGRLSDEQLPGHRRIVVGHLYAAARADAKAEEHYRRALEGGHYPEALLALAEQQRNRGDRSAARELILAALDTNKPAAAKAASAFDVFPAALGQLLHLEEPVDPCRAWISQFLPGKDAGPLTKRSLMIFARSAQEAESYVRNLVQALQPGVPPLSGAYINIQPAPRDLQPARPVRPGVQYVYN